MRPALVICSTTAQRSRAAAPPSPPAAGTPQMAHGKHAANTAPSLPALPDHRASGQQCRHAQYRWQRPPCRATAVRLRPAPARPPIVSASTNPRAATTADRNSGAGRSSAHSGASTIQSSAHSTLLNACPGSCARNAVSSTALSPSLARRPVRPPATAPHKNIAHRKRNAGVRTRIIKKNREYAVCSSVSPSWKVMVQHIPGFTVLELSPLHLSGRTWRSPNRGTADAGTNAPSG